MYRRYKLSFLHIDRVVLLLFDLRDIRFILSWRDFSFYPRSFGSIGIIPALLSKPSYPLKPKGNRPQFPIEDSPMLNRNVLLVV